MSDFQEVLVATTVCDFENTYTTITPILTDPGRTVVTKGVIRDSALSGFGLSVNLVPDDYDAPPVLIRDEVIITSADNYATLLPDDSSVITDTGTLLYANLQNVPAGIGTYTLDIFGYTIPA